MAFHAADFEKTEDELLLELATQLTASGEIRYSGPLDDEGRRERARRWVNGVLASLKGSICSDPRVIAYLHDSATQNRFDIAGVVVDILSASAIKVPVGTLALLIVKGRLHIMCG
ncbi:hypothetical protein J9978_04805 [Chromobacterium violaceum]|uniref:hypothetical protein n=1 Tax=Chromobacterium violaceum TaxID=536 RepID=UPI001B31D7EE|nr:hypothetical protein [Chromobacterium violaceum]MBP4048815.1 hypothetical protein [Chromobacterium violaceum]